MAFYKHIWLTTLYLSVLCRKDGRQNKQCTACVTLKPFELSSGDGHDGEDHDEIIFLDPPPTAI